VSWKCGKDDEGSRLQALRPHKKSGLVPLARKKGDSLCAGDDEGAGRLWHWQPLKKGGCTPSA